MAEAVPLVRVVRSGLEESVHLGHVAVCDVDGRIVAWAGNPAHQVFARSCMKPMQAAVSLRAIGPGPTGREVAVMCASHNGEPEHVRAVRRLLSRSGVGASALRCPPGWPIDPSSMARARTQKRILHNCSGKHAGMLLACARSGWDLETYVRASHPLQRRVGAAVLRATGLRGLRRGVDGCGVPVHGMPLSAMATLFARLGRPDRLDELAEAAAACTAAMRAHPYLVGGRDRADTALMTEAPGVIAKEGAEALMCAALPEAGLGVAVKIADGGWRATPPALLHCLVQMGVLTGRQLRRLSVPARPPVRGGGRRVGSLEAGFALSRR